MPGICLDPATGGGQHVASAQHPFRIVFSQGGNIKQQFPRAAVVAVEGPTQIAADLERLGVQKIGPSHCTGDAAVRIFRERWGENFVSFNLGDSYQF